MLWESNWLVASPLPVHVLSGWKFSLASRHLLKKCILAVKLERTTRSVWAKTARLMSIIIWTMMRHPFFSLMLIIHVLFLILLRVYSVFPFDILILD